MSQSGPAPRAYLGGTAEGTFDHSLESRAAEGALVVKVGAEGEQIVIAYAFALPRPVERSALDRIAVDTQEERGGVTIGSVRRPRLARTLDHG